MKGRSVKKPLKSTEYFRPDQAGRQLLLKVPTATLEEHVGVVRDRILRKRQWDTINYIYVLDAKGVLKGVASIKELMASPKTRKMTFFRKKEMAVGHPHSRILILAARAIRFNIKAIPIVDERHVFLGVIGADTVLSELERHHVRELFFKAGVGPVNHFSEVFEARITDLFVWRFPWLFTGLIGGVFLTAIMSTFHHSLEEVVELAFFVPMIVYMADAVGTQTQTIYIRGIAFGAINGSEYVWKEFRIDVLIGLVSAGMVGAVSMFITHDPLVTAIVSIAMFLVVSSAGTVAVALAILFKRFTRDPALGGGPLTTVVQDSLSVIIYFLVATALLSMYG